MYTLTGDTAALRIPPATTPGPADGLWQHTCFEAFVAAEGDAAYREFNFSPSGQWAAYRFAGERQRDTSPAPDLPAPVMQRAITPTQLTLDVHLPRAALPSPAQHLVLALCAVVEEHDGRLSYWALQHPQARPDFHHPAGRALRLALPQN
ncbi:MAG: DOMON-like domain-containing protein [Hydrogenophaga sp.]